MAGNFEKSGISLVLDTAGYSRAVSQVIADANKVDMSMDEIIESASRASRALDSIDGSVDVNVNINDQEVVTARGDITDIGALAPEATVNIDDNEVTTAAGDVRDIGSLAPNVTVTTDISDPTKDLAYISGQLETLKTLSVIDIAMNMPGNIGQIFESIPGFNAIVEMDNAVRTLDITTTETVDNVESLISGIYIQGFGKSRVEIGRMIGTLANLGVAQEDLGEVATALFETQTAIEGISGEAPVIGDLFKRMQSLKELGLVDSFKEAGDVITAGFQSSIGISGDFLGDLGEFAPTLATLGFTAQQMLNTLDTGLAGGVDNISRMAEGIISFNEAATQAPENVRETLAELDKISGTDLLGELDLFQAGQTTGADFMASVLDSARTYADSQGIPAVQGILGNLFGGTASNIGAQALLNIDPNADGFTDIENRAQEVSDTVQESFESMFDQIGRLADETARAFFSSDAIDLDGKLATLRGQIAAFLSELESGNTIAGSLTVAFQLPPDAFTSVESSFNNFIIGIMTSLEGFLRLPVIGDAEAADSLSAEIARISEGQLAFDLKLATSPEEVAETVRTALERGVAGADIGESVTLAINEAAQSGDFAKALNLAESAAEAFKEGSLGPQFAAAAAQLAGVYSEQLNEAITNQDWATALPLAEAVASPEMLAGIQELATAQDALQIETDATATANEDAATRTSAAVEETKGAIEDYTIDTADQYAINIEDTIAWANQVTPQFEKVGLSAEAIAGKIATINATLATMGATPVPDTAAPLEARASGGSVRRGQTIIGGEEGAELFTAPHAGSIINAANTSALMSALSSMGMGGNTYNTTNVILNSTANVQNNAQADVFGTRLSRQIRGFS